MKHIFLYFSLLRSYSFLPLSFPIYYFPCLLIFIVLPSVFAYALFSLYPFIFYLFPCLSSTSFLAVFYPSRLVFFVYHLLSLSASVSFSIFYFPSWLSSIMFLCLSSIIFPLLFSISFRVYVFYYYYYDYYYYYTILLSVFCTFQFFVCCFFLFWFSYFVLFSTLFDYLVLILDFNYYKFSLLFIFS